MTLVMQGEIRVDSEGAKASISSLRGEQDKLKTSAQGVGTEGRKAARDTQTLGNAAEDTAADLRRLSAEERAAATASQGMGASHQLAAGQVGNLTAQFNDIGVMFASGQNPLQLALQQGTQITQVIGPLGAAGAARALGSAFLSMLSPLNLITIGSIAAGAALGQWLVETEEKAKTLDEALDDLKEASERLSASEALAAAPRAATQEYRYLIDVINEVDRLERQRAAEAVVRASGLIEAISNNLAANSIAAQIGTDAVAFDFLGLDHISEATFLLARVQELTSATRSEQAAVLNDVTEALQLRGILTQDVQAYLSLLSRQLGITDELVKKEEERKKATEDQLEISDRHVQRFEQELAALRDQAAIREAEAFFGADSLEVAELRLSAERRAYEAKVDALKISEAEKDELVAAWDAAKGIAEVDMAGNISLAADQASRLAENLAAARAQKIDAITNGNADFFDPRNESGLSGRIVEDRPVPPQNRPGYKPPRTRSGGSGTSVDRERQALERLIETERERIAVLQEADPVMQEMIRHRDVLKNATDAERKAVEELIRKRLEEQGIIRGSTDLTEFLRNTSHNALAGLIVHGQEAADVWDQVRQAIAAAALEALLLGEGPLAGPISGLLGGFGGSGFDGGLIGFTLGLFGLADGGAVPERSGYPAGPGGDRSGKVPILGSPGEFMVNARATRQHRALLEAINAGNPLQALAGGGDVLERTGYLTGPGGDRSDRVPLWASPGEFMVNARATRQYRPLLEAINSGTQIRGLADGGFVTPPPSYGGAFGSAPTPLGNAPSGLLRVSLSPDLRAEFDERASGIAVQVVQEYDRFQAPETVQRVVNDPHAIG